MKRSLLEDLYWGNLAPADKGCCNNPKLLELLDGGAKELFDAFSEAQNTIGAKITCC